MTSVGFYHLTKTSLEQALPVLLVHTMQRKQKTVVLCKDNEQIKSLTEVLWNVTQPIWLPHGCHFTKHQDEYPQWQPIWLTLFEENPNQATYFFVINGQMIKDIDQYQRVFDLFDGKDEQAVCAARERWKRLKQEGHDLTYWKQTEKRWVKE